MSKCLRSGMLLSLLLTASVSTSHAKDLHAKSPTLSPTQKAHILSQYGRLPLAFEQNTGQTDARVKFQAKGPGYHLFLTPTQAVMALRKGKNASVLRMTLKGANPAPAIAGQNKLPGQVNYLLGRDKSKWRTHIATYKQVAYKNVYKGVDLRYYGNARQLEYDFIVQPGANASRIKLGFDGAKSVSLTKAGGLTLCAKGGSVSWHAPVVYQTVGNKRVSVSGKFVIANNVARFAVGKYDHTRPLVIDPILEYSTYLGGSGTDGNSFDNSGFGICVDSSGEAYVTGTTASTNFPASLVYNGGELGTANFAFVTKMNASGTNLVYSTLLGGSDNTSGNGVMVDSFGYANVVGVTYASDFPVTDGSAYAGSGDAFIAQLYPDGASLYYSKYLNPSGMSTATGYDSANAVAIDPSNNIYVAVSTYYDSAYPGIADVVKYNDNGGLVSRWYVYGNSGGGTDPFGIAYGADGNVYVTGYTTDTSLSGANDALHGSLDAFVAKLPNTLSSQIYATYLGGSSTDVGLGIAADSSGNAYVAGYTYSSDFPLTEGSDYQANDEAFVTKISPDGTSYVYSTFLNSTANYDAAYGIVLDSSNQAYVTGFNNSTGGVDAAFVTQLNSSGGILSTLNLTGSSVQSGEAITLDSAGNAYLYGITSSTDFTTTAGAYDRTNNGGYDAFVAKINYVDPVPTITNLNPTTAFAGGPSFTLTVTGTGFVNGASQVYFGSTALTTTYVSPSELTATVPASAIATVGNRSVTVKNPSPGGGTSNGITFAVTASISLTISPTAVYQGAPSFAKISLSAPVASDTTINITSSNTAVATVPASRGIPAGKSGVRFDIVTASSVTADTPVTITVSYSGGSASATLTVKTTYTAKGNVKVGSSGLSGVAVTAASTGTFTLSQEAPSGTVIPAGGTATVSLPITVPGTIIDTRVGVKVTHPNIYKLAVSLIAPDGTTILLRGTQSGTATGNGFETDYPVLDGSAQSLSVLNGKPVQGTWKLQIQNTGPDTGTVDIFDLNFNYQGTLTQSATTNSSGDYSIGGLKAATYTITPTKTNYAFNPTTRTATVGPTQTGLNFTAALKPTLTSLSATSASSGGGDYTLTVNGTNFVSGAHVNYSGTALTTTFVSSTQLKAIIPASLRATPGTAQISVTNPSPGGTSNSLPFTFTPKLTGLSLSPTSFAGGGSVTGTVTLNGASPSGGTVITLSSSDTSAATVASTVTVPAGLTSVTFPVTVKSITTTKTVTIAATGAGATKTATLTVSPVKLSTLSLSAAVASSGTPVTGTVKLTGTAPSGGTKVTLSSSNTGVATVPSTVTVAAGATSATFTITTKTVSSNTNVAISASAGGVTKTQTLTVTPAASSGPSISSLSPSSATAGGGAFTLTVNGTGFASNSIVKWNGASETTTYVSATKLTALIPAALIASAGTAQVTVTTPHVSTSAAATFTINPAAPASPVLSSVSPTTRTAGGGAFTLTANGSNFVSGSIIKWNGATQTTTFVSSTKLTAAIPASLIASPGTASITVTTPHVGTSGTKTVTINP